MNLSAVQAITFISKKVTEVIQPYDDALMVTLLCMGSREDFKAFLYKNANIFAWSHEDMPGIDPNVIAHRLNIDRDIGLLNKSTGCSTQNDTRPLKQR